MQMNTSQGVILAAIAILITACASPNKQQQADADATAQPTAKGTKVSPVQLEAMKTFQYLLVDPDRTGVRQAADDGRYTYIAMAAPVTDATAFFDQDGQPLQAARAGPVVALPAIYKGILVRSSGNNSYIAPNPRAAADDRPPLEADPDVVAARTRMEVALTQMPAFKRAMQRADAAQRGAAEPAPPANAATASTTQPPADDPNVIASDGGRLVRVWFASGGRAIVRPDDGLQRIEAEASRAHEIQVTGFTDSLGPHGRNAQLARERAEAVRELLIKRGIPPERITLAWSAKDRYIGDNNTEEGRALNRRVEVLFLTNEKIAARSATEPRSYKPASLAVRNRSNLPSQ